MLLGISESHPKSIAIADIRWNCHGVAESVANQFLIDETILGKEVAQSSLIPICALDIPFELDGLALDPFP